MTAIRRIAASPIMSEAWPAFRDAVDEKFQDYKGPSGDLNLERIKGLHFVYCDKARPHTDPDHGWTALWVFQSSHVLFVGSGRHIKQEPLINKSIFLFDSRRQHWTSKGDGLLICGFIDFWQQEPTEDEVISEFETIIKGEGNA